MKLLLRFFGFLFAVGTIFFIVGVAAVAGLLWHFSKDLPDYSQLKDYEPPVMTRVHAGDGSLLAEYAKERRLYLPIQAIPKLVINAFVAAEDKNFYQHPGVDLKDQPEDVAGILIDLAQRETKTFSLQFANRLVAVMKRTARLHKEPIKSAGFRVLRAPDVPSVLVELGYVSNKEDLQSLSSDSWRDHTADAAASAIDGYFSTHLAGARAGAN